MAKLWSDCPVSSQDTQFKAGNQKRHLLAQFKIKQVPSSDNQGGKLLEDTICDRLSIQEETPSTRPEIGLSKHIPIR